MSLNELLSHRTEVLTFTQYPHMSSGIIFLTNPLSLVMICTIVIGHKFNLLNHEDGSSEGII